MLCASIINLAFVCSRVTFAECGYVVGVLGVGEEAGASPMKRT